MAIKITINRSIGLWNFVKVAWKKICWIILLPFLMLLVIWCWFYALDSGPQATDQIRCTQADESSMFIQVDGWFRINDRYKLSVTQNPLILNLGQWCCYFCLCINFFILFLVNLLHAPVNKAFLIILGQPLNTITASLTGLHKTP